MTHARLTPHVSSYRVLVLLESNDVNQLKMTSVKDNALETTVTHIYPKPVAATNEIIWDDIRAQSMFSIADSS